MAKFKKLTNVKQVKFRLFILSLLISISAYSQRTEIGLTAGSSYYLGELNKSPLMHSPSLTYGLIMRRNIDEHYALRASVQSVYLRGADADMESAYQKARNHSFNVLLTDISVLVEFNFLPFDPIESDKFFTPTIAVGSTIFLSNSPSLGSFNYAIPFSAGIKYAPSKQLILSLDWNMRKTFTDQLDQLAEDVFDESLTPFFNKQQSYNNSKDWYATVSYQMMVCRTW